MVTQSLPLLDLTRFRTDRARFLTDLRHAAHEIGFFYVTGHGVPESLMSEMFTAARRFFALPLADRLAIENIHSPQFRGYTRTGQEHTGGTPDWREQLDVGPERVPVQTGPDDPVWLRLIGPNQWPAAFPDLRATTLAWQAELLRTSLEILRALAASLNQPETYFNEWFDDEAAHHLKIVHYPGTADSLQGVGAHKDYGYLALLQQDTIGGLQVQSPTGTWIDATPIPGTFVVNIGEMLEIATNGYLTATPHRVQTPPPGTDRISIPFFLSPRLDAVITPLHLPEELATHARGITQDEANPLLATYGENALIGWLRSHPPVARRWWPDLTNTS
ncbi:isopenicillin N synthase family dioxygenase [Actinokineospora enzanensis]|uniref:isopenicillin N synthase family dioxygenase n=1 Tax=Actinokineospora enzanensis TaxID=155975 RepID=UPI001FE08A2C|nr:2-oxoglutarate and iron-dependent oxygenase domain-containing protein [Actinokineospora enzanensis]